MVNSRQSRALEFIFVFIFGSICWAVFIIHKPFEDHELALVAGSYEGAVQGKIFLSLMSSLHGGADVLVLNYLYAIGFISLLSILFSYRLELNHVASIMVGCLIISSPVWSGIFYYSSLVFVFSFSVFLSGCSALLVGRSIVHNIAAFLLLLLSIGTYQAGAATYPIIIAIVAALMSAKGNVRASILHVLVGAAIIIAAYGLYRLAIFWLGLDGSYVTATASISELPDKVIEAVRAAFQQFWVNLPDYTLTVRSLEFVVVITALLAVVLTTPARRLPITLVLVIGAIVASKALYIVTDRGPAVIFQYRYNLGIPFLYGGIAALGLASMEYLQGPSKRVSTWLSSTAVATLCLVYAQQDLIRQTVLYYGQMQDVAIMNRVLARIENSNLLSENRTYQFVRTGPLSNFRRDMLAEQNGPWTAIADEHMDFGSIGNLWVPESLFNILGTEFRFRQNTVDDWRQRSLQWRQVAVDQGRRPWPAPESLWLKGNTLILHTFKTTE
jgi:hypothetical protein